MNQTQDCRPTSPPHTEYRTNYNSPQRNLNIARNPSPLQDSLHMSNDSRLTCDRAKGKGERPQKLYHKKRRSCHQGHMTTHTTIKPRSINAFDLLGRQKSMHNNIRKKTPVDTDITTVCRAEFDTLAVLVKDKPLEDYLQRFLEATMQIKILSEDAKVMGTTIGPIQEFLDRVDSFIKLEDAVKKIKRFAQPEATSYNAYNIS
uniref:Uncharacterized protein n=1 Tax=Cannabis sativa TaxID=3483 RepID=A0A803P9H9_CANSA